MKAPTKAKWFGAVAVAVLMLSASSAGAAQDSRDLGIALEISHQIDRYPRFTIFDFVTGKVDNGGDLIIIANTELRTSMSFVRTIGLPPYGMIVSNAFSL